MTPNTVSSQWWSATATWRLVHCPASATPAREPVRPTARAVNNVGSLAHLALQAWVESGEWSLSDTGTRLQHRFDEVVGAHHAVLTRMPQGVVTRARLKSRAKEIAAILAIVGGEVSSEQLLRDEANHLFGILDLVGTGPHGFIIDFKTGRDASAASPLAIEHQMTFYAHLFQSSYGSLPERVFVFSLQQRLTAIRVTPSAITSLLDQIRVAKLTERTVAHPAAFTCRFCPKRMTCQSHWDAALDWEHPDALEGTIDDIERSSSGATAVRIGGRWLTGIPKSALPVDAAPGHFARAVRVRRRDDSEPEEWAADRTTLIGIKPNR